VCRPADGDCDLEEVCDGSSATCPATDYVKAQGVTCRETAGVCDLEEVCDGVNKTCPEDALAPDTQECRAAADICDPAEYCTGTSTDCPEDVAYDPTLPGCYLAICRTPGFWGTHGTITQDVIDKVGCIEICGEVITNTVVKNADSALEAMCISKAGGTRLQLVRQLTATALNCIETNGNSSCDSTSINELYDACNSACASGSNKVTLSDGTYNCSKALDCYNNGGEYNPTTGYCKIGTCSITEADCNGDGACPPVVIADIPTPQTCVHTEGNCHDQPLCSSASGLCFDATLAMVDCSTWPTDNPTNVCTNEPGPATTERECQDANKSACTVIPTGESAGKCINGGTISSSAESCEE